jgi:serine phosphatase RsbU (regulator of sigma subunit)
VHEPAEMVDALRWSWALLGFERIATGLFARLDPATGEVVLASAGHLPPLHVETGREARLVPIDSSPPFGLRAPTAVEHKVLLGPGDVLFFYTDGLVEEPNSLIVDRLDWLVAMIEEAADRPLEDLCDHVLRAYARTRRRQPDDLAVMAVKRLSSQ